MIHNVTNSIKLYSSNKFELLGYYGTICRLFADEEEDEDEDENGDEDEDEDASPKSSAFRSPVKIPMASSSPISAFDFSGNNVNKGCAFIFIPHTKNDIVNIVIVLI